MQITKLIIEDLQSDTVKQIGCVCQIHIKITKTHTRSILCVIRKIYLMIKLRYVGEWKID